MTDEPILLQEQNGDITTLTMVYRPHNLIGPKLMRVLKSAIEAAVEAKSRAVILKSGLRHFSAGADLDLFDAQVERSASKTSDKAADADRSRSYAVNFLRTFELAPMPIVASVHGVCLGGGLELALICDYIIAAASTKFGSVEATIGLNPLMGGVQRQVQRIGAARAKEMSLLARRYDAATMERWGLINLVVPDEDLDKTTLSIAEELAHGPTLAHAATKQLVYLAANEGVLAADEAMAELQKPIWASEDLKIGLASLRKNGPGLARFGGR